MNKKDKSDGMPYSPTPSCDPVFGQPESCYELINKYGTYNIQPTADTANDFPAISHGLSSKKAKEVEQARDEWKKDCLSRGRQDKKDT